MGSESMMLWGLVFGSIGFGYFIYGKKQKKAVPLIVGLCLMAVPYVVSSTMMIIVGVVLMAVAYFYRSP
jgi:hypothetical protein